MTIRKNNPWETADKIAGLIPLTNAHHALYISCSGPARKPGQPIALLFTGAGVPIAGYVKVQEHLGNFVRTAFHDRAGYDQSTLPKSPIALTAEKAAEDLDNLLEIIRVKPPYILVAHSYGGILARVFLEHQLHKYRPDSAKTIIAAMVMFDTQPELTFALFPRIPSADLEAVARDVNWAKITHLKSDSEMSDKEWQNAMEAIDRSASAIKREGTHESARMLAGKRQFENHRLGDGILSVIRCNSTSDYQRLYDEGIKLGGGTSEQRQRAKGFIENWNLYNHSLAKAQTDLVHDGGIVKYTYLADWGHDSPIRSPRLVADVMKWVLEHLQPDEKIASIHSF